MTLYFSNCNDPIILFNNIHRVSIHIYLLSAHYYIIETKQKEVMILLDLYDSNTAFATPSSYFKPFLHI